MDSGLSFEASPEVLVGGCLLTVVFVSFTRWIHHQTANGIQITLNYRLLRVESRAKGGTNSEIETNPKITNQSAIVRVSTGLRYCVPDIE